jgi:uncharacterized membrane protein YoaK (UPF0700 family)
MNLYSIHHLASRQRTSETNQSLGLVLTFVAGATNAGGFLAVLQYTSHMTGIVASISDNLVLGNLTFALAGMGSILSFIAGAACSALLINWARRKKLHSEYALPLLLETILLLCFGFLGGNLLSLISFFVPVTVMLLCFIMGLQNAIITKVSKSEIRTTHVTGIVTDIGIELGKLVYWNKDNNQLPPVVADRARLKLLISLLTTFFIGGIVGALGFKYIGFSLTIPLASLLLILAAIPIFNDINSSFKKLRNYF